MPIRFRAPIANNGRVVVRDNGPQLAPIAPTELNYDVAPARLPRQFAWRISHNDGFSQHGTVQTWGGMSALYLPPISGVPLQRVRNIGAVYGIGKPASGQVHVPSVLVPRTIG